MNLETALMKTTKAPPFTIVLLCRRSKRQVVKSKQQMQETEILKGQKIEIGISQQQKLLSQPHRQIMPIEQLDTMLLVSNTI